MTSTVRLWITLLVGPVIWFASMMANLSLAPEVCARGWKWLLFTIVAIALAVTAAAGGMAWRYWRQAGVQLPGESGGSVTSHRVLGLAGMALSAAFLVVIVAQAVPNLMLGGCE